MYNEEQIRDIGERLLKFSNADETEVLIFAGESALSRFGENEITQNVAKTELSLSVRIQHNNRVVRLSTNKTDDDSLKKLIENAMEIIAFQKEDPALIPMTDKQEYSPIANSYFEETANFSPKDRADAIKRGVDICAAKELEAAGIFKNGVSTICIMNSKGVYGYSKVTNADYSITAIKGNNAGWAEKIVKDVRDIKSEEITNIAVKKAIEGQNPADIEPGKYTVVLEPAAVTDFLSFMAYLGFGALPFLENRSYFSGKTGQKVFGDKITITDDAYDERSVGIPFDFEGMPKKRVVLIENGIFKTVVYDRKTAKIAGVESTGHSMPQPNSYGPMPMNLVLTPGTSSIDEMIESTEKGLLITHFHYTNVVNPKEMIITGMTRDGVFLIENGKVTKPVKNMRFTEAIPNMFNNVEMIGKETILHSAFFGGGFVVPGLKINNFTFTSKTEF